MCTSNTMWTLRVAAMVVVVAGDMNTTVPSQLSLQSCVCPDGRQGSSYEGPFSCRSHMPIPGVPPAEAPPDFGISVGEMTLQTCIDVCASWASDHNGHPCVAVEWADGGNVYPDHKRLGCWVVPMCNEQHPWEGGSVYRLLSFAPTQAPVLPSAVPTTEDPSSSRNKGGSSGHIGHILVSLIPVCLVGIAGVALLLYTKRKWGLERWKPRYDVITRHDDVYEDLEDTAQGSLPKSSFVFNNDADDEMLVLTPEHKPRKRRKTVTWAPETWDPPRSTDLPSSPPAVYEA